MDVKWARTDECKSLHKSLCCKSQMVCHQKNIALRTSCCEACYIPIISGGQQVPISTKALWGNILLSSKKDLKCCGHKIQSGLDLDRYEMFSVCHSWLLLEQLNFVIHWKADEIWKSDQSITRLLHMRSTFIAGSLCLLFIFKILMSISHLCHLGLGENWCNQTGTDCYIYPQILATTWFIHHRLFVSLTYIWIIKPNELYNGAR